MNIASERRISIWLCGASWSRPREPPSGTESQLPDRGDQPFPSEEALHWILQEETDCGEIQVFSSLDTREAMISMNRDLHGNRYNEHRCDTAEDTDRPSKHHQSWASYYSNTEIHTTLLKSFLGIYFFVISDVQNLLLRKQYIEHSSTHIKITRVCIYDNSLSLVWQDFKLLLFSYLYFS